MSAPQIVRFGLGKQDAYIAGENVTAQVAYILDPDALISGPGNWETIPQLPEEMYFSSTAAIPGIVTVTVEDPLTGEQTIAQAKLRVKAARKIGAEVSPIGGCGTSVNDWMTLGLQTFGPLEVNKQFYGDTGELSTYAEGHKATDNESHLPRSCTQIICYASSKAGLEPLGNYLRSVPSDVDMILVFSQEAENNKWPSGKAFLDAFKRQSDFVRGLDLPHIRIAQDSGTAGYNKGGDGADGSYFVPDDFVDLHLADFYHNFGNWPSAGLRNSPKWNTWLSFFSHSAKPLGIAEYGIDGSRGPEARRDLLEIDISYLHAAFTPGLACAVSAHPLEMFTYWWSDCTAGVYQTSQDRKHQFTDQPTIDLFRKILAGEA